MIVRETAAAHFDWLDIEAAPDSGPVDETRLANMAIMVGAAIGGSVGRARLAALVHDGAVPSEVITAAMALAADPAPADEQEPATQRRDIERDVLAAIGMCCIPARCREAALVRLGIAWERFMFSQDGIYDLAAVGLVKAMMDRQRGEETKRTRTGWHGRAHALILEERSRNPSATLSEVASTVRPLIGGTYPMTVSGLERQMRTWERAGPDEAYRLEPFPRRRRRVLTGECDARR